MQSLLMPDAIMTVMVEGGWWEGRWIPGC